MSSGIEEDDTIQREKRKNREEEERMKKDDDGEKKEVETGKETPKRNTGAECRLLTVSTVTMVVMATCGTLHLSSWIEIGKEMGLYSTLRNSTWESYNVLRYLVDADKLFWTWVAVYGLQLIWILSGILLTFQKTSKGRYLYTKVTLMPFTLHVSMVIASAAILAWVILWEKYEWELYSLACIAGAALFSFVALVISMLACRSAEGWLVLQDKAGVLVLIGLLVQNGVAAIATMTSVMTNFHMAIILQIEGNISPETTSYVSFGMNLCFIAVYFIIDTCLSDRHAQCVVTPYILVSLTYVGAYFKITNQGPGDSQNDYDWLWILSLVGAGAAGLMLLVKIIVSIMRAHHRKVQDRKAAKDKKSGAA